MYDPRPFSKRVCLDACLSGLGGTFETMKSLPKYGSSNIVYLEMLNVVVAFKIWVPWFPSQFRWILILTY